MADTSQRKTRYQSRGNNTQAERNRLNASIPQGNEHYGSIQNVIRSENIQYQNTENFSQTETSYYSTAKDVYNESELVLQSLETKKARLSYTVTFASNTYTFTAKTSTISEIVDGTFNNQEFQDKIAYNSPIELFDGFNTSFVAPATSTGTTSIAIQLYDGSFTTKALKKYNDAGTLVSVVADDIVLGRKYDIVIIGGEAVLFGVMNASQTTAGISYLPKTIFLSNNISNPNTQLDYSAGTFKFSDESGSAIINSGTINFATNGANGLDVGVIASNTTYHCFAIYNPTTKVSVGLASTSPTSPTLPSGYTKFRRVGSAITNASSQIYQGTWFADGKFLFTQTITTLASFSQTINTETLRTIHAPLGISTDALVALKCYNSTGATAGEIRFRHYSPYIVTPTMLPDSYTAFVLYDTTSGEVLDTSSYIPIRTNTSSQIKTNAYRVSGSNNANLYLSIEGWIDYTLNY